MVCTVDEPLTFWFALIKCRGGGGGGLEGDGGGGEGDGGLGDGGGGEGEGGEGDGGGGEDGSGGGEGDGGGGEGEGGSVLDKGLDRKVLTCSTAWSGVYWTEYDGDAVVKSTGSHCGGQATPRFAAEGRAFELRCPIVCGRSTSKLCSTFAPAGQPRISQCSFVSQVLEPVDSASRLTSVSVLALGSETCGLHLLIINDRNLSEQQGWPCKGSPGAIDDCGPRV